MYTVMMTFHNTDLGESFNVTTSEQVRELSDSRIYADFHRSIREIMSALKYPLGTIDVHLSVKYGNGADVPYITDVAIVRVSNNYKDIEHLYSEVDNGVIFNSDTLYKKEIV